MKLIVAGSRGYHDRVKVWAELDERIDRITEIVSGMALEWLWDEDPLIGGPDRYGYEWSRAYQKPCKPFRPDWSKGKSAGMKRNAEMADYADAAIVFWDGKSPGTEDMLYQMDKRNKPTLTFNANESDFIFT